MNEYLSDKSLFLCREAFQKYEIERAKIDSKFAMGGRLGSGLHINSTNNARKDCLRDALSDVSKVSLVSDPEKANEIVSAAAKRLQENLVLDLETTLFANSARHGGHGEVERDRLVKMLDEELTLITMNAVADAAKRIVGTEEIIQQEKPSTAISRISEGIGINVGSAALKGLFVLLTLGLGTAIVAWIWKAIVG